MLAQNLVYSFQPVPFTPSVEITYRAHFAAAPHRSAFPSYAEHSQYTARERDREHKYSVLDLPPPRDRTAACRCRRGLHTERVVARCIANIRAREHWMKIHRRQKPVILRVCARIGAAGAPVNWVWSEYDFQIDIYIYTHVHSQICMHTRPVGASTCVRAKVRLHIYPESAHNLLPPHRLTFAGTCAHVCSASDVCAAIYPGFHRAPHRAARAAAAVNNGSVHIFNWIEKLPFVS